MGTKRLLVFLVPGILLCLVGIVLMLCGAIGRSTTNQIGGVIFFGAAIPLILEAKLIEMSGRVRKLEQRLCRRNGKGKTCVGSRYADDEEE